MNLPWLEDITKKLDALITSARLGHAPLIHGAGGTGKRMLGQWLTRRLLCLEPDAGQPCARCQACRLIDAGTHPDLFIVEPAEGKQGIEVGQIRDLSERLQLTASLAPRRVGLISDANAMNQNAANALLKTLEEPPAGAWLILLSRHPARLAATIRSRCQPIALHPPAQSAGLAWLEQACPDAGSETCRTALALSDGAPLAAREMLESDGIEFGMRVLDGLSGKSEHIKTLNHLLNDPLASWQWLARWLALLMHQASHSAAWQPNGLVLPNISNRRALARLWQQALAGGLEAERGAVRQDLLLGQWLLEWETLQRAGN